MGQPALSMRQVRKLGSERLQELPIVTQQIGKANQPATQLSWQEMM